MHPKFKLDFIMSTIHPSLPSSIYISSNIPSNFEEVEEIYNNPKIPAYERIGRIYARTMNILQTGTLSDQVPEFFDLLKLLGVEKTQVKSAQNALNLLQKLPFLRSASTGGADTTGVYFLSSSQNGWERVFKIGPKRASTELLAAKHADWIGLGDYVVSGLHCVLKNLPQENGALIEETWNGSEKEYLKTPNFGMGIIEPFLESAKSTDPLLDYSKMLLVALSIGLRDGKRDGVTDEEYKLFDLDDIYSIAIDPPAFKSLDALGKNGVAATDLPLLADKIASQPLSLEQIDELASIVKKWDLLSLATKLSNEPILYADRLVESQPINEEGEDETGARYILQQGARHLINRNHKVDINTQDKILNESQVIATMTRMDRLKRFIIQKQESKEIFTPLDLVYSVDPFLKAYKDAIEQIDSTYSIIRQRSPFEFIGRCSPSNLSKSFKWPSKNFEAVVSEISKAVTPKAQAQTFGFKPSEEKSSTKKNSSLQRRFSDPQDFAKK